MLGIYVHIPFCNGKCPYCDFYSLAGDEKIKERYVEAVLRELEEAHRDGMRADTLYFGGGTPTLLTPEQLGRITAQARRIYGLENAEITTEANPNSVTGNQLAMLRQSGINRISFGVQSAVDGELGLLGRKHTAAQAGEAIALAKQAGFDNISCDLMLGIPSQTPQSLAQSLDWVNRQNIQHVSAYLLKVEPSTPYFGSDLLKLCPNDDTCAELYLQAVGSLTQMGFKQYEISNFSVPGLESRHNLKYWQCGEYLGVGAAAHSFLYGRRYGHSRELQRYLKLGLRDQQFIDETAGGLDERLMLGLRLTRGVALDSLDALHDSAGFLRRVETYKTLGLLSADDNRIALTPEGFLLSNTILSDLIGYALPPD